MDTTEQVSTIVDAPPVEVPEAPVSIAEHASQFGPNAKTAPEPLAPLAPNATEAEKAAHHSAQQRRDRENGQFRDGKVRHRAKSQQASPEDVPRIQKLTAEKRSAEERVAALEAEVARLKTAHAPPKEIAKAEAKVEKAEAATDDPEPKEDDPKYAGDYGKFLRDVSKWEARDALRQDRAAETAKRTAETKAQQERESLKTWAERVESARQTHTDFDAVAFAPTIIPAGSVIDTWIMEHKAGPAVLYYLQAHRQELGGLLTKPVLEQVEDLALLSQRLLPSSSSQAGTTGSAAGTPQLKLPPRPPNPVRTEAQRATDSPPPTDGSLSIAEHSKQFGKRR